MSAYTVQKNGIFQFTADGFTVVGDTFNFVTNTPPPPPAGRLTTAVVSWITHDPFSQITDLTKYKNVAGVIAQGQTPVDWPYISGPTYKWLNPAGKYTALEINVPGAGMPITTHFIKNPHYAGGVAWDVSISTTPGDFDGPSVLRFPNGNLVYKDNVQVSDTPILYFKNGAGTNFYVGLNPGGTYYLNFRVHGGGAGVIAVASQ